jgi:oxygen-dependent protoporphyrinogen oxidase
VRIAVVGGGIAGLSAAYELATARADFVLFEAFDRLGGLVETVRERGFIIECGPDAWVTEKPWARDLAIELGLESELLPSNDATRKTYIARDRELVAIPDGMRMMVPSDLEALDASPLFSEGAKLAYRGEIVRAEELKAAAPLHDESVASFVARHFGDEVAMKIAAPLLAGVFGGDIASLSVRSVMPAFVAMEREHGSLVRALQTRTLKLPNHQKHEQTIFTTITSGLSTLINRMAAKLPASSLCLKAPVASLVRDDRSWRVNGEDFDAVIVATPADTAAALVKPRDQAAAALLPQHASSAVVVALGFDAETAKSLRIPPGFGFLVPQSSEPGRSLLAATFTHQKFAHRAANGAVLVRAFFGGAPAESLLAQNDLALARLAREELSHYLGPLPSADVTVVRRWPRSLPQYEVGHQERIAEFDQQIAALPGLRCVGSAYHGVGLPDLVRDGRAAARNLLER